MRYRDLFAVAGAGLLCLVVLPAGAEVLKTVKINSAPPGAEVFLLQGSKETKIGTTPFSYHADFHSEMSVLRVMVRKAGYEPRQAEINAHENNALIRLSGRRFTVPPKDIADPGLRQIQQVMAPAVETIAAEALKHQAPFQMDLPGGIRTQKLAGGVYLVVPVTLLGGPHDFNDIGARNADLFLYQLWSQLDGILASPLAKAAKSATGLGGILLDVEYSHLQRGFNVGVKTQSRIEMECQGGMKPQMVFDSCATRSMESRYDSATGVYTSEYVCQGGMVSREVYDPCATRVPVTYTDLVADPQVMFDRANSKARYMADVATLLGSGSAKDAYGKIKATLKDKDGRVIAQHGSRSNGDATLY